MSIKSEIWENWRKFFEELKKAKIIFGGGEDEEEDHYEKIDKILATTKENLQSRRQKFKDLMDLIMLVILVLFDDLKRSDSY